MSTLNIAYLILAHQHPGQLSRLVEQLRSPAVDIFVHVDAKTAIDPFRQVVGRDVHFTPTRIPVYWADYSQIRAVLLLIEAALAVPRKYDYLVLLSGVDYPLRSAAEIENFLAQNKGSEFINWVAMPSSAASKPLSRLTDYHGRPGLRGLLVSKVRRLLIKLHVIPRARDYKAYLGEATPYAGSTWWALTRDACEYIRSFAISNPRFMKFFENTSSPDEMVFQTILANSPFRSNMRRNLSYTDWSDGGASPSTIGERHLALFRANPVMKAGGPYGSGEVLFCRKVMDATISDRLAAMIAERNAAAERR
ncbi:beta-1,6-N-acetylglucosaminyltransferase [Bradyrhizobium genosp. P]|uniref:beta-1,6-N-acetylglucosaminyltransferase n=1 Tax=Bradyrhizobium genosp. P TaxID=83641 RepID=UPI003CE8E9D7